MTSTGTRIAAKAQQATASLRALQGKALELAQAGSASADDWARYANEVASAEGEAHAWIRVQMTVDYFERKDMELTDAVVLDTVVELLTAGADDSWSGRVNDTRRARFDGIRKACTAIKYIVVAD